MSDIAEHYGKEIERLTAELTKARKEAQALRADRNGKVKTSEQQLTEANAQLEKLKGENLKLAKKLETLPAELGTELEKVKGELRTRDHKAKFADVAKELGSSPEAVDALWKLSDYKADADQIDEEGLKTLIEGTLAANPFLKATQPEQERRPIQIPGGGQGSKAANPAGSFTMTYEQGRDLEFLRANRDRIHQASSKGLLVHTGFPSHE